MNINNHVKTADITLLLEGTYPYVSGGVSSWVHQIILGLPEFSFSLVFLGGARDNYGAMKYALPDNVVHLECHYLMDDDNPTTPKARRGQARPFADIARLHDYFRTPESGLPKDLLTRIIAGLGQPEGVTREDFLHSEQSWELICNDYSRFCTDPSFVDFFWTVRSMHAPLFMLAGIARQVPPSHAFHAISTGYAGFLGMLLHQQRGRPFLLSEHGIYTKERTIDLTQAGWIKDARETFGGGLDDDVSYIRRLWIRFFEGIGRLTYAAADPIVALYEGNRRRQIADGADAARTQVIPNGIDLARFAPLRIRRAGRVPPIIGLLGRVVPIKDIKTFIRAMRTVCTLLPDAEGWIIGPEDEDEEYVRECRELVTSLGLEGKVKFLGFQKPEDVLPQLGLLALTSISEALPLVILEGFASGLPVLSTDVGSCRELIEGNGEEDRALGAAGAVVPIADPESYAREALALLTNGHRWHAAQAAGIARVERYYTQPMMYDRYRRLYQSALQATEEG
ncbi:MAG: GT4 family glycosyltransferase PelF [Gammaproteobacteria bacterium]|nr:GT4 family glycosyltransferase PelF [Gammaproteobacteria bacterium]